jgi:hypothetical protein
VFFRLSDQSIDILKHLSTRGGVWATACAAAIRDLSVRFSNRRHFISEETQGNAPSWYESITADTGASSSTRAQTQPRAAIFSEQYPRSNANSSSDPAASSGGTGVEAGIDSDQTGAPCSLDLVNTELATHASLYPHNSEDTSLETMFSIGYSSEQTDLSLFEGFDIPFWIDDDEYASLAAHWDAT